MPATLPTSSSGESVSPSVQSDVVDTSNRLPFRRPPSPSPRPRPPRRRSHAEDRLDDCAVGICILLLFFLLIPLGRSASSPAFRSMSVSLLRSDRTGTRSTRSRVSGRDSLLLPHTPFGPTSSSSVKRTFRYRKIEAGPTTKPIDSDMSTSKVWATGSMRYSGTSNGVQSSVSSSDPLDR